MGMKLTYHCYRAVFAWREKSRPVPGFGTKTRNFGLKGPAAHHSAALSRHATRRFPSKVRMRAEPRRYSPFVESQDHPSAEHDYLAREAKARVQIDKQLADAGWKVQSQDTLNLGAGSGVAVVAGIPTARFRDRLVQMAANAGLWVIAVDPAYTSRWVAEHWLAPLRERVSPAPVSGHHAAAVVIGRRALAHRARRRAGVTGGQRISRRRAAPRAPVAGQARRNGRPRQAQRQPPRWPKTATAQRTRPPDQATQDRPGPPASQDPVLLAQQKR